MNDDALASDLATTVARLTRHLRLRPNATTLTLTEFSRGQRMTVINDYVSAVKPAPARAATSLTPPSPSATSPPTPRAISKRYLHTTGGSATGGYTVANIYTGRGRVSIPIRAINHGLVTLAAPPAPTPSPSTS